MDKHNEYMNASNELTEPIKGKEELINENIDRAVAVYRFLLSLPDSIARTVFSAVVDDAYEIAEVMDLDAVYGSLAKSLLENCYSEYLGDIGSMDQFLDADGYSFIDTLNEYVSRIDNECIENANLLMATLADVLMNRHPKTLPDRLCLVRSYPMFTIGDISEFDGVEKENKPGVKQDVENRIREGLRRINGEYEKLEVDFPMDSDCFYSLGYITFPIMCSTRQMHLLSSSDKIIREQVNLQTARIYKWYCKGEVLDYVIEAFKRAKSRALIDRMWEIFTKTCMKDRAFKDVFQDRFDKAMGSVSTHRFACKVDVVPRIAALDPIPMAFSGSSDAGESNIDRLWEELGPFSSKPYVKCTLAEFKAIFSGRSATVSKPLVWYGKGKELGDFIQCCQGEKRQSNRKFLKDRVCPLFVNYKSGKPFEVVTLKGRSKYDYEDENSMRRVFGRCGLIR